jgi:hypothetical protein
MDGPLSNVIATIENKKKLKEIKLIKIETVLIILTILDRSDPL